MDTNPQKEIATRRYWFKRRWYGWGWYPATWEGWLILAVFIGSLVWLSTTLTKDGEPTSREWTWYYVKEVVLIAILIGICFWKGEKPKWQWGRPKDSVAQDKQKTYDKNIIK